MVFYGTLRKLCSEWCDDRTGSLQNDLICGEGDVESTEPLKMLLRMTRTVREQPDLADIFRTEPSETLLERASTDARFSALAELVERYLDLYGFRCVGELKLEERSLRDRPQLLYQTIKHYLAREDTSDLDPATIALRQRRIRRDAERRAFAALARYRRLVPRATIFRWVLANARRGVRNRESMRLARARIYAVLREMLHAIAEHFEREQILESSADIFYLTIDEVWDFIKGTAVTTDLRGLVNLRRAEFEPFRSEASAPANRFATYGAAYHRNCFRNHQPPTAEANGTLRGTGCCPGIVTGPARLIRDPTQESCRSGDILVAEQTDPGWTPLYPTVSGILIERGSILSHSAIVAREMAIPTIVGIAGLTHCVRSGQPLTMNGSTGTVVTLPTQGEAVTHLSR